MCQLTLGIYLKIFWYSFSRSLHMHVQKHQYVSSRKVCVMCKCQILTVCGIVHPIALCAIHSIALTPCDTCDILLVYLTTLAIIHCYLSVKYSCLFGNWYIWCQSHIVNGTDRTQWLINVQAACKAALSEMILLQCEFLYMRWSQLNCLWGIIG